MEITTSYPPNYDDICKVFPVRDKPGIIFTYGSTLHCPNGMNIPGHLMAHEQTHMKQQGNDPKAWWDKYLIDTQFRLSQELEAYRNQYKVLLEQHNREERRTILNSLAKDLSSSIYGNLVDKKQAKLLIQER